MIECTVEADSAEHKLKKSFGQLMYLQNLVRANKNTDNTEGAVDGETGGPSLTCPVCTIDLEVEVSRYYTCKCNKFYSRLNFAYLWLSWNHKICLCRSSGTLKINTWLHTHYKILTGEIFHFIIFLWKM